MPAKSAALSTRLTVSLWKPFLRSPSAHSSPFSPIVSEVVMLSEAGSYAFLHSEYLSKGLSQTLSHMVSRFPLLIPEQDTQRRPDASELTFVVLTLHLNEIEFALTFFYFEKTYKFAAALQTYELLMLCGFHAKYYFNTGISIYRDEMNRRDPSFATRYSSFANEFCSLQFPPTSLNDAFTRLRRSPEPPSHLSYDLNYQTDLLKWGPQPSFRMSEDRWKEVKKSLCYRTRKTLWGLAKADKAITANESDIMPRLENHPVPLEPFPPIQRQSSVASEDWMSPIDDLQSPSLDLNRQMSLFSSLPEN